MSEAKQKAIAICPKFTGFLSILGSGFIIYDILCSHFNIQTDWFRKKSGEDELGAGSGGSSGFSRQGAMSNARGRSSRRFGERKTLKNSAYYRLMLSMSTSDFIVSFAWFCTTWPIPKDEDSLDNPSEILYGNVGTMHSCTAQAFFIQLGIITPFYNALLSLYYYLTIRREWKEEEFKWRVEIIGHFISISFGLGTSIAGLVMELYNNSLVWCWINSYPWKCGDGDGQEPCVRGLNSNVYRWAFYYGPLWFMIVMVAFFMTLVYVYVRGLDVKMSQYTESYMQKAARASASADTEKSGEIEAASATGRRPSFIKSFSTTKMEVIKEQRKHRKNERSKAVANQGLFYAGTFALVWVFGTTARAMQLAKKPVPWAILFLFAVFTPSQGFFNFLVYIRPKLVRYYAAKKKRRNSADSFSSNALHVSSMSGVSGTSSVDRDKRDVSIRSEDVKLIDPFMKSEQAQVAAAEPSTVKTKVDTSSEEAMSE